MYNGLHVKHRYSCPILMKLASSPQIFEKFSNIKFNENPSSGSRVVPCGRTDMTELTVDVRNFVIAPKKKLFEKKLFRHTHTHARKTYVSSYKHKTRVHTSQIHELSFFITIHLLLRCIAAQACVQNVPTVQAHHPVCYYYYYVTCHRPFLPGMFLEPAVNPIAQVSTFTL